MSLKQNEDMVRKEEPTNAITPDKLDRSPRKKIPFGKNAGKPKPYPLTEEEATPNTPRSEEAQRAGSVSDVDQLPVAKRASREMLGKVQERRPHPPTTS